ncbi:MAG: hypothetical protein ABR497_11850 [Kiritimatiellia bacterium]|nr:hypothetical protein [Lentisphaerota bacterium]
MADIYFNCRCGKSLAVDERNAGRTVTCVDCTSPVRVPTPEIEFGCEHCPATLLAPLAAAGKIIACTCCGHTMAVPVADADTTTTPQSCMRELMRRRSEFQVLRPLPPIRKRHAGLMQLALAGAALVLAIELWQTFSNRGPPAPDAPQSVMVSDMPALIPTMPQAAARQTAAAGPETNRRPPADEPEHPAMSEVFTNPAPATPEAIAVTPADWLSGAPEEPGALETAQADVEPTGTATDTTIAEATPTFFRRYSDMLDRRDREQLRRLRDELTLFIHEHAGRDIAQDNWHITFQQLVVDALHNEIRGYAQSETLTRESIAALLALDPADPAPARRAAMGIFGNFAFKWFDHAPESVAAMLDKMERTFITAHTSRALKEHWYFRTGFLHTNLFLQQYRIPEERRADFIRRRVASIRACIDDLDISLRRRSRILAFWSYFALFQLGHTDYATELLDEWWARYGVRIGEVDFYRYRMAVELLGNGNWERAAQTLEAAGHHSHKWQYTYEKQAFNSMTRLFYDKNLLPGYELQRRHRLQQKTVREKAQRSAGS